MTDTIKIGPAAERLLRLIAAAGEVGIEQSALHPRWRVFNVLWKLELADFAKMYGRICCVVTPKGSAYLAAMEGKGND